MVAWDGDEIAGSVTNVINERENAEFGRLRGLLDSVAVRRPWRGRGLGYAWSCAAWSCCGNAA